MDRLAAFENYLRYELNRSPHTIEAYLGDLREFAAFHTGGRPESFAGEEITKADIRKWLGYLGRHEKPSSIRRKTQSLRAFFRYLMKIRLIEVNPAGEIVLAKLPKPLPEFVADGDMESLLADLETSDDPDDRRDHLILTLLYTTGMRRAELCSLSLADIDTTHHRIKITGKRDKQRVVPLHPHVSSEIERYVSTLRGNPGHDILIDIESKPLDASRLYRIVHSRLAATSAHKKSPHVLRHTFATSMLNNGAGIESVKEFLGHESLATTQIYTHVSFAELRAAYKTAHPRSKPTDKEQ